LTVGKLRALDVDRLGPGMHPDGQGLYLQVIRVGARSWIWRYSIRRRRRGLGSAAGIS